MKIIELFDKNFDDNNELKIRVLIDGNKEDFKDFSYLEFIKSNYQAINLPVNYISFVEKEIGVDCPKWVFDKFFKRNN